MRLSIHITDELSNRTLNGLGFWRGIWDFISYGWFGHKFGDGIFRRQALSAKSIISGKTQITRKFFTLHAFYFYLLYAFVFDPYKRWIEQYDRIWMARGYATSHLARQAGAIWISPLGDRDNIVTGTKDYNFGGAADTSISISHTIPFPSSDNGLATVNSWAQGAPSSVTYGGKTITSVTTVGIGGFTVSMNYDLAPAPGNQTAVVNYGASVGNRAILALTFTGVRQTLQPDSSTTQNVTTGTVTFFFPYGVHNAFPTGIIRNGQGNSHTAEAGTVVVFEDAGNGFHYLESIRAFTNLGTNSIASTRATGASSQGGVGAAWRPFGPSQPRGAGRIVR